MNGQGVRGVAWPWRDVGRHFAGKVELPIGYVGEQRNQQVLQRNHPNAKLHQLGIRQVRHSGCASGEVNSSCRRRGPAPPSFSHLESAIRRCSEGSGNSGLSWVIWRPSKTGRVRSCFTSAIPAEDANPSQQRCKGRGAPQFRLATYQAKLPLGSGGSSGCSAHFPGP